MALRERHARRADATRMNPSPGYCDLFHMLLVCVCDLVVCTQDVHQATVARTRSAARGHDVRERDRDGPIRREESEGRHATRSRVAISSTAWGETHAPVRRRDRAVHCTSFQHRAREADAREAELDGSRRVELALPRALRPHFALACTSTTTSRDSRRSHASRDPDTGGGIAFCHHRPRRPIVRTGLREIRVLTASSSPSRSLRRSG